MGNLILSGTFALTIDTGAVASGMVTATALTLIGSPVLTITDLGGDASLSPGTQFVFVDYGSGSWNGGLFSFNGTTINNGDDVTIGGNTFEVIYNDTANGDNSVTLNVVPEPGVISFVCIGLLAVTRRIRQNRRSR